jgi:hypothetical protein
MVQGVFYFCRGGLQVPELNETDSAPEKLKIINFILTLI